MTSALDMGQYAAEQSGRVAWYLGQRFLGRRLTRATPPPPRPADASRRPAPPFRELLADLAELFARDAENVLAGLYPPPDDGDGSLAKRLTRAREVLADMRPAALRRAGDGRKSPAALPEAAGLPEYYLHDFHFQDGGYLTRRSARLYDTQVEVLFLGAANAMRRQALAPLVRHFRARDQRRAALLDIGCGTGRLIDQIKQALPALPVIGVDLSHAYLAEARELLARRRGVTLAQAAGEALALADASIDAVTCVFVYHELPPVIRGAVAREAARVLRPGGLFVLIDSLQYGDRPGWDGLLDGFGRAFNEPYYQSYIEDQLVLHFEKVGLALVTQGTAFFAKILVFAKGRYD